MLIRSFFLLFIWLFLCPAEAKEISITDYVELLKNNDSDIETILQQKAQTRFNVDLNLPTSSWVLSLSNTYGFASQNSNRTSEINTSLTKNFRESGTTLSMNYNENELADRNEKIQSVRVQQSLVQNAFGLQTRFFKNALTEENKTTQLQLIEAYEDYIAEKMLSYLDFIAAYESYKTSQSLLKDIKTVRDEVQSRKDKSVALDVDLDRAESQVLQYERQSLESQYTLSALRKNLFDTVTLDSSDFTEFKPQKLVPFVEEMVKYDQMMSEDFLKKSRTMQIIETSENSNRWDIKAQSRNLYPELNFILGYNQDESTRFSTTVNREETQVGLNLNYQFDNSLAKARIEQSQYNLGVLKLQNISKINNLKAELVKLNEQIKLQRKRVKLLKKQSKVLNRLVGNENKRFKRGLLNLRDFIQTQNNYTQVQYDLIQQKVNLAKAIVSWKQITDTLIQKF